MYCVTMLQKQEAKGLLLQGIKIERKHTESRPLNNIVFIQLDLLSDAGKNGAIFE